MIELTVKEVISNNANIFIEKRTIYISKIIITSGDGIIYIHLYDLDSNTVFIICSGTLKKMFTKSSLLKVCKYFYVIRGSIYKSLEDFCNLIPSNRILQIIEYDN